ncbi:MAG: response regulator [Lachnospiraceae bacterium]|nr:response regulator [Lachnospiraceae bacterium]
MKSFRKKRKMSYSAYKLVQILCILLALFDIAVTTFSTYVIMEESVTNQIELTESKIAEYMNKVWNLAGAMAENKKIQDMEIPLDRKVEEMVSFAETYGLYSIGVVNADGDFSATDYPKIINISDNPQFQELKENPKNMLTDIYLAERGKNTKIFTIWRPFFDERTGDWLGAVEISVYFDYMQNIIEGDSIDGKCYFCMYDSKFDAAAHANIKARGESFEDNFALNSWVSKSQGEIKECLENREKVSYWKIYEGKLQYCKYLPIRNTNWQLSIRTNVLESYRIAMLALSSKVVLYIVVMILFRWKGKRESKKRQSTFSWMTDMVDEIFIMQNVDTGEIEYISNNAERIMGYSTKEIRQQQNLFEAWLLENDVDIEEMNRSQDFQFQRKIVNPHTGEQREFGIHIYVRHGKEGNYRIAVIADKTQEIRQKEALETSLLQVRNASKAKSRFLSNMSHDIRTPMNAIVGMTTIAKMHLDCPEKVQDCIHKIELSSMHLKSLINDVLDMSKIESGKVVLNEEAFNLRTMLEELGAVMQVQAAAKKQEFSVEITTLTHEVVISDCLRIQQVLTNVLGNAIKFTPEGGKISLMVEETENRRGNRRFYEFYCMDSGIGMSKEMQEKVFLPFERGRDSNADRIEGTGLGMAITKNIVNMMGGTIEVISSLGEGSTFIMRIPLQSEEGTETKHLFEDSETVNQEEDALRDLQTAGQEEDTSENSESANQGEHLFENSGTASQGENTAGALETAGKTEKHSVKAAGLPESAEPVFFLPGKVRILLVEDNELNMEIAKELLGVTGAEIDMAWNGREGAEKFAEKPEQYYDLILSDVQMPEMDGHEMTREIRAMNRADAGVIPIVAMTANAFSSDVLKARRAGMTAHLAKPIDLRAVYRTLRRYIPEEKQEKS